MIVSATEKNLSVLASVEKAIFDHPWSEAQLKSHLDSAQPIWIYTDNTSTIQGYMIVSEVCDEWEVLRIAVLPEYRRKGHAQTMLSFLEQEASPDGTLFLEVRETNISACQLYKLNGFIETGRRKGYYQDGEDALLMMKSL